MRQLKYLSIGLIIGFFSIVFWAVFSNIIFTNFDSSTLKVSISGPVLVVFFYGIITLIIGTLGDYLNGLVRKNKK